MRSLRKLISIITIFSLFFFALRIYGSYVDYDINVLVADLGGLTYLYSTVGTIFAIFAAFVIVSESQDWNTLRAAASDEVRDLNEIAMWAKKLSSPVSNRFLASVEEYLKIVAYNEWRLLQNGVESDQAESTIAVFHDLLAEAGEENPDIASHLFAAFAQLLNHRAIRIEYSWQPLPTILKFTVIFVASAVMGLSLFIGVKNIWLDYLFMVCIVALGSVILVVVDDLDNPLRPGDWYLTNQQHVRLLGTIRKMLRLSNSQNKKVDVDAKITAIDHPYDVTDKTEK